MRVNKKKIWKIIIKHTKYYCENTTLHGFRYVCNKNYCKSLIWLILSILSILFCIYLIHLQLDRYSHNRIATSISTTSFPIWKVPFPAVTICNFNIVHKKRLVSIQKKLNKFGISEDASIDYFRNLSGLILNEVTGQVDWKKFEFITKSLDILGYNTEELMRELAQPCETMIDDCFWKGNKTDCDDLFTMIKTESGFCCSFNFNGLEKRSSKPDKTKHVQGIGPNFGMEIYLNIDEANYISNVKVDYALDVKIHDSYSYPDNSFRTTTIYGGNKLLIEMEPQITEAAEDIRSISLETRNCLFEDERNMIWSEKYSFSTCMSECKAKQINSFCKCVPYYYPMLNNTNYCTLMDAECLNYHDEIFNNLRVRDLNEEEDELEEFSCDCPASCSQISYLYQVDNQKSIHTIGRTTVNKTILMVFFGRIGCTKYLKHIFLTWDIILASVGGIFGLCLGGSILSIIELIYYIIWPNSNNERIKLLPKPQKPHKIGINIVKMPSLEYLP